MKYIEKDWQIYYDEDWDVTYWTHRNLPLSFHVSGKDTKKGISLIDTMSIKKAEKEILMNFQKQKDILNRRFEEKFLEIDREKDQQLASLEKMF